MDTAWVAGSSLDEHLFLRRRVDVHTGAADDAADFRDRLLLEALALQHIQRMADLGEEEGSLATVVEADVVQSYRQVDICNLGDLAAEHAVTGLGHV